MILEAIIEYASQYTDSLDKMLFTSLNQLLKWISEQKYPVIFYPPETRDPKTYSAKYIEYMNHWRLKIYDDYLE